MTTLRATLRRWAGVRFVAALLPSLIGGLFFPNATLSFVERPIVTTAMLGLAGAASAEC